MVDEVLRQKCLNFGMELAAREQFPMGLDEIEIFARTMLDEQADPDFDVPVSY
jgi:hypothetical protein